MTPMNVAYDAVTCNDIKQGIFSQWCHFTAGNGTLVHLTRAEYTQIEAALKLLNIKLQTIRYGEPKFYTQQAQDTLNQAARMREAVASGQWDTALGIAYQIMPAWNPDQNTD